MKRRQKKQFKRNKDVYKRQDYYHKVRINYYPPRNDNKEGWDNIDIFGWMGYPMQIDVYKRQGVWRKVCHVCVTFNDSW